MVRWYNPVELLRTGIDVFFAEELNERTEDRIVSLDMRAEPEFVESARETGGGETAGSTNDFWLDFLADTGDGYEPTYAVAHAVSREYLELDGERLFRGSVLVLGGDCVYPVPSRENYEERLLCPFEDASSDQDPKDPPTVYALPGNHDAYDGLVNFARLFLCRDTTEPGRRIGIWKTRQTRSYFAIRLPRGYWLWGADVRGAATVDARQGDFFRAMAEKLQPEERVILVTPRPDWLIERTGEGRTTNGRTSVLAKFGLADDALSKRGASAPLHITGDIHNYQRFRAEEEPEHRLISGGGGAFLHPTHRVDIDSSGRLGAERLSAYPTPRRSFALSLRALFLPLWNPGLSVLTAAVYVVFAWPMLRAPDLPSFVRDGGSSLFLAALLMLACGFYAFPARGFRVWGGLSHGVLQTVAAYASCRFVVELFHRPPPLTGGFYAALFCIALAGAIVLPVLLGSYLFLSLTLFGFHPNEAFSALRLGSYKHFVRMCIGLDGALHVYAIGIDSPGSAARIVDQFRLPTSRNASNASNS